MNYEIATKLDDLIITIKNNLKVKRIMELKEEIYKDDELKKQLNRFHEIQDDIYSNEYVSIKKEIIENELIKEFKILENELYFLVLEENQKMKALIDRKKCTHESN